MPDIISKEPLGPSVRHGDDQWFDVVKWTHYAMINAEELGITADEAVKEIGGAIVATVQAVVILALPVIEGGFSLGEGEIELGLGIHGEQGVRRVPVIASVTIPDRSGRTLSGAGRARRSTLPLAVKGKASINT